MVDMVGHGEGGASRPDIGQLRDVVPGAEPDGGVSGTNFYESPMAVIADPFLTREQKLQFLRAWGGSDGQGGTDNPDVKEALAQLGA